LPFLFVAQEKNMDNEELLVRFRDWIQIEVAYGDASPHTIRSYLSSSRGFLKWCKEKALEPTRVSKDDIKLFRAHLIHREHKRGTVATKLAGVRRFYDALQDWGVRLDNPATKVRAKKDLTSRAEKVAEKYISDKDAFLGLFSLPDASKPIGVRDRAVLRILCFTGIRVSELCALDLLDIKNSENPRLLIRGGKGHKRRHVPIGKKELEILREWIDIRCDEVAGSTNALFISMDNRTRGRRIGTRGVRSIVNKYLKQLGLKQPGRSCHALRHSLATWLVEAGVPTLAIADLLGHSTIETTAIYAKIVDMHKYTPSEVLSRE
jgi:site-specific recombinase XerD